MIHDELGVNSFCTNYRKKERWRLFVLKKV